MDKTISELDELMTTQDADLLAIVDSNDDTTKKIQVSSFIGGGDTNVQFNDGGVLGGNDSLAFDNTSSTLTVGVESLSATLQAQNATTTDTGGCNLILNAGNGLGSGRGGSVEINGGNTDDVVGGEPGNVLIQGGHYGVSGRGASIIVQQFMDPIFHDYGNIQLNPGNDGGSINGITQAVTHFSVGIGATSSEITNGDNYLFISNVNSAPAVTPTNGGIMYVQAGALKYLGSSGTVTTIAPA